mmetsp:Transcript_23490/g.68651  ORF Transcript_23490/g.68651 Transcript_23490/m.68651 type:complete len:203 (+) Transcript_23490:2191-2799(+)
MVVDDALLLGHEVQRGMPEPTRSTETHEVHTARELAEEETELLVALVGNKHGVVGGPAPLEGLLRRGPVHNAASSRRLAEAPAVSFSKAQGTKPLVRADRGVEEIVHRVEPRLTKLGFVASQSVVFEKVTHGAMVPGAVLRRRSRCLDLIVFIVQVTFLLRDAAAATSLRPCKHFLPTDQGPIAVGWMSLIVILASTRRDNR